MKVDPLLSMSRAPPRLGPFFFFTIANLLLASAALASDVPEAKVKTLATNKVYPGLVFIEIAGGQKTSSPSCQTNGTWAYVLKLTNDDDKRMFALLTAAKLTQGNVRLAGSDLCDAFGSIESLSQVWLI